MHYVYVPYKDKLMDEFAASLVDAKNKANRFFGRHTLIARDSEKKPLSVVGWNDRLYVCMHGRAIKGFGSYMKKVYNPNDAHAAVKVTVDGDMLAGELVAQGLPNVSANVRLWACWGALGVTEELPEHGHDLRSFATKFHAALQRLDRAKISVTAYTQLVSLATFETREEDLKKAKSKAKLGKAQKALVTADGEFIPTKGQKITLKGT